jgi:hypothetical protein
MKNKPGATLLGDPDSDGNTAQSIIGTPSGVGSWRKGLWMGTGDTDGGPLAPFGPANLTGGDPTIFVTESDPITARPPTVIFLCDASGSMLNKFESLRHELRRAVSRLRPSQSFNVIFFAEQPTVLNPSGLLVNRPENRARADRFLDEVVANGQTKVFPALELAFKQHPQVIFLLTDGDFPDNKAVAEAVRRLNSAGKAVVNTIAFVDPGESYEEILRQIARENHGRYRFVGESDLQR